MPHDITCSTPIVHCTVFSPWFIVAQKLCPTGNMLVRELMGWVRNVVLIKCIFGSGKPKGGRDFGWEGT